jgi:signal transduction histidine kinase
LIGEALGPTRTSVSPEELTALRAQLQAPLVEIIGSCAVLLMQSSPAVPDALRDDLRKIGSAAERLVELADADLVGGARDLEMTPTPRTKPASAPPERPLPPGRVLVVDDNDINRDMLMRRLERQGLTVKEAGDGSQALNILENGDFDLILLDIMMPVMDGYQVLAALKADTRWRDLPVIMLSALDELRSVARCIEMGADDYLPKPFDPILLRARIGACLEKKRLRDLERQKTEELERTLSQLKATQDQLVVQEKLASLGALTAGIAHEIKNPLNFVTNFAALSVDLVQELRGDLNRVAEKMEHTTRENCEMILADLEQNVAKIAEHGRRADSIVRGMLLHSRGQKGERQPTDINALVAEYVNLAYHGLRAQDSSFNITLTTDYDKSLGKIDVVPQDLSRVILNIANNACYAANQKKKAAGAGFAPTLTVWTKDQGDHVEIRIRDNGTGVPASVRDKLFQPFFTTKPTGQGTGLGLSISRDIIVQGHQGELLLDSEEGQFTEFTIRLPKGTKPS